jgi:cytochrome P450
MAGRHLSFGHGHHFCLGSPLIQVELQEVLRALLDLPCWELAAPPEYTHFHLQDRGPSRLQMRFDG